MSEAPITIPDADPGSRARIPLHLQQSAMEPRGLTLADLLATLAGISLVLATMPAQVAELWHVDAWDIGRFPNPRSRVLMAFLFGSWFIQGTCIALVPAMLWRLFRYRRTPFAGEWLALFLILAMPTLRIENLIAMPFESFRSSDAAFFDSTPDGRWREPSTAWIVGGWVVCGVGLAALNLLRGAPALAKTLWITGLFVLYTVIPARSGWQLFRGARDVPHWNAVTWQEYTTSVVEITLPALLVLPALVALMCFFRGWLSVPRRTRPWTEWVGPVLSLGSIGLYRMLVAYRQADAPDGVVLILLGVAALSLILPIEWAWKRWWS